jgi:hypothetical protein
MLSPFKKKQLNINELLQSFDHMSKVYPGSTSWRYTYKVLDGIQKKLITESEDCFHRSRKKKLIRFRSEPHHQKGGKGGERGSLLCDDTRIFEMAYEQRLCIKWMHWLSMIHIFGFTLAWGSNIHPKVLSWASAFKCAHDLTKIYPRLQSLLNCLLVDDRSNMKWVLLIRLKNTLLTSIIKFMNN